MKTIFEISKNLLMKRLYTVTLITFLSVLSTPQLKAQGYLGLYFNGAKPLNELNDSGYRNGVGMSIEYLSEPVFKEGNFNVRLGGGFDFLYFGHSKKVENLVFNTPNNDKGYSRFENYSFNFFVAPKFIYNVGRVSPYVDLFAGLRGFNSSQTNTFYKNVSGYDKSTTNTLLQNGTVHYGFSGGLLYRLTESILFDLRVSYSTGRSISFTDLNSPMNDPQYESNVKYRNTETRRSSDLLIFRLGVLIELDVNKNDNSYNQSTPRHRYNFNNAPSTPNKPAEVKPVPKPQQY